MALYSDYRPRTFDDVSGQNHVVTTLQNAVKADKIAHAYIFAGTRGTGKTSTARILAETLLTRGIQDETLKRQIVEAMREGTLVDLIEIDAASNTGVDNIRDLIEKIQFSPIIAKAKVYIIDEVHMLSKGAFNALLKTLEEPPEYAYFILATTELHKIPMTIQSRCQRFLFKRIDETDIAKRLRYIADTENITVEDNALNAIAHHVGGGMRDAVSLLDQLRSLPAITLQDVKERIGETGHEYVEQTLSALNSADRTALLHVVAELENVGVPLDTFARLLLEEIRKNMHVQIEAGKNPATSLQHLDALMRAANALRHAPLPGLVLESALLELLQDAKPIAVPGEPSLTQKAPTPPILKKPEPQEKEAKETAQPSPETPTPSPTPNSNSNSNSISLQSIKEKWPSIVQDVSPPAAKMALRNGHPYHVENGLLTISFNSSFNKEKAASPEGAHSLEKALEVHVGIGLKPQFVLETELIGIKPAADSEHVDLAAAARDVF